MILLFWVLAAYGMTSILVWGSIFEPMRIFIKKHSKFFGKTKAIYARMSYAL